MKSINSLIPFRSGFAAKWFRSVQFCCQKSFWAFELSGFHSLGFKGCVFDYQPAWVYWGRFEWALGFLTEEMASISGFWAVPSELLLSGQGQGLWLSLWRVQGPGALTCVAKAKGSQCSMPAMLVAVILLSPWTSFRPKVPTVKFFSDIKYSIIFGKSLKNIGLILYKFTLQSNAMKYR